MRKPRVFISSTFYDLRQIRDDLERFVRDVGYDPVRHETGAITYGKELRPEDYAYQEVEQCDIFISVIGGRFGTSSAGDPDQSISQMELKRALENDLQVYIFIETNVRSEFHTYQLNKENPNVNYRYVDDVRIFRFIEELHALTRNNPIANFEVCADIIKFLRLQWAGLFQRLLAEKREQPQQSVKGQQAATNPSAVAAVRNAAQVSAGLADFEFPDELFEMKWTAGVSTLDVECTNISSYVFENMSLHMLDIHRWSDERTRFIRSEEINQRGEFAPLTLHTQGVRLDRGMVLGSGGYSLFHEVSLVFLFLSLDDNRLNFSGQRGSQLGTYTIHTPGIWRVCFRALLPEERFGWQTGTASPPLKATKFMYFNWDGANVPVPCEAPVA